MRARIARAWGYTTATTTTPINADNTLVSTDLTTRFPNNDMLNNWFVQVEGAAANNNNAVRHISDYVAATGTITTSGAVWADEGTSDYSAGLYRYFHPADILTAFQDAATDMFPAVALIDDNRSTFNLPGQRVYPATARLIDSVYVIDRGTPGSGNGCWLNFNGLAGSVTVTDASVIQNVFDSGGTIEAWIYPRSDGEVGQGKVITKTTDTTDGWALRTLTDSNDTVLLQFEMTFDSTAGAWRTTSANAVPLFTWTHVAVTYDNGAVGNDPTFYINGAAVSTITESSTPVGTRSTDANINLVVGNQGDGLRTFDGYIDEVRVWSDTRTAAEIADKYQQHVRQEEGNLVCYLPMDLGVGSTVNDLSLGQNNGTIVTAIWVDNREHIPVHDFVFHAPHSGGSAGYIQIPDAYGEATDGVPSKIIRMVGRDLLTTVSADTDTFEVDGDMLELLTAKTRLILAKQRWSEVRGAEERARWLDMVQQYQADVDAELNDGRGMSLVARRAVGIPDA